MRSPRTACQAVLGWPSAMNAPASATARVVRPGAPVGPHTVISGAPRSPAGAVRESSVGSAAAPVDIMGSSPPPDHSVAGPRGHHDGGVQHSSRSHK